ncbi:MAG TPA: hypothetical protein VFK41_03125 [Nocardioidaceae bacterium]|nr:hypothetical protein [Nocardioidaceae bacterium]
MKASDNEFPSVLFDEQASDVTTPGTGLWRAYFKSDGLYTRDDAGTVTGPLGAGAAPSYSTYVPELTAATTNPTLGTASIAEGRYVQDGDHVFGDLIIKFGTSGVAAGSGNYRVSLPVAARESAAGNYLGYARGSGFIYDDSASAYRGVIVTRISDTLADILVIDGSTKINNASPWTWAANDALVLHFDYEAA